VNNKHKSLRENLQKRGFISRIKNHGMTPLESSFRIPLESLYEELYDLRTDPGQLNNIAAKPEYAKQKRKLVAIFEKEFTATYDPEALGIPPRPKYLKRK